MIILIGPLPPPVHGASVVTRWVLDSLTARRIPVSVCNVSPRAGSGFIAYHFSRLGAYLACWRKVLGAPRNGSRTIVYLSLSGGLGLIYDSIAVAFARMRGHDIIFHHHAFSYLDKPSTIMRATVRLAGSTQTHVTLCQTMAKKLAETYGASLRIEVVSNLAFFQQHSMTRHPRRPLGVVGFLSNISLEKGIDRYLDLMEALRDCGSRVRGAIAGPFADQGVRRYVERRVGAIGTITYHGPVYGREKAAFLDGIDLLVFPTRYANEAEPLVVYEAQAAGVPVAASDRGCLSGMVGACPGLLLDPTASDTMALKDLIEAWENDDDRFAEIGSRVESGFAEARVRAADAAARFASLFQQ